METRNTHRHGLSRRALLQSSVLSAGVLGLAACGTVTTAPAAQTEQAAEAEAPAKTEEAPKEMEPVTIQYYTALNDRQQELYPTMVVDEFQAAFPGIQVETILREGPFYDKLHALVAAGEPPDTSWFSYPEAYLRGVFTHVTDYVKRDNYDISVFPAGAMKTLAMWEGDVLGLPNQSGGSWPVMPYNKEILASEGISDPPLTWTDDSWNAETWLEALQKLAKWEGNNPTRFGINSIGAGVMVYWGPMWAGSWVSEDLRSVTCDSEEMIEGITYLTDLVAKYRVMDKPGQLNDVFGTANARDLFFDGKLAFFRTSGGQTFAVAEAVKDGKPYGFAPIPKFGIVGSGQAVDPNGIINGAKHPDEGWEFIKWQADTPNWAITRGNAPSRQDHFTAWGEAVYGGFAEEARVEVYADSLGYAVEIDPVFSLPNWRIPIWRDMVGPAMTKLYNGEGDVKETLEQLRVQIEGEMPEFE